MERQQEQSTKKRYTRALTAGISAAAIAACGAPEREMPQPTPESTSVTEEGCEPFTVLAQNRWAPQGAVEREKPDLLAKKLGGFAGNDAITVVGWKATTKPVYPLNPPPWDSDVWLLTEGNRWVAFASVRSELTTLDPTGVSKDGGAPVELDPACKM